MEQEWKVFKLVHFLCEQRNCFGCLKIKTKLLINILYFVDAGPVMEKGKQFLKNVLNVMEQGQRNKIVKQQSQFQLALKMANQCA